MTFATTLLALMWASVTAYALLAGADFGAGAWDLLAGRRRPGARRRALMEHSIGPVWEANHVWLIFVLVLMWTAFPPLFASVSSTLYLPLTLIALGVIARGSAFAFRKAVTEPWLAGLTVGQAAAGVATLQATTICAGVGIVILIPSLAGLFLLFQREQPGSHL